MDHVVHLALNVAELLLLGAQLVRLAKVIDLSAELLKLLIIGSALHFQVIVVLYERLDLVFKRLLIHGKQLLLQTILFCLVVEIESPHCIDTVATLHGE